ncbi:MAG TPA: pyridoxamine 5'-phosphate oxidase family protein [Casimicrobiaceae bacterium]|nr:pyridoxamine 5'-phosphate oxidase family protein [Casimicrobiaceae bacterium]
MAKISDEMARMIAELRLCYVATVTPEGRPNLSPKGSLRVVDGDHLAFADIMSPQTMRNLKANPYIEINIVHPFLRRGYRFKGRCDIVTEGATFELVANELWQREGRQYPVNAVVSIEVEAALPVRSPAYVFNKGVKEEDVRRIWLERYGVQPLPTSAEKQP